MMSEMDATDCHTTGTHTRAFAIEAERQGRKERTVRVERSIDNINIKPRCDREQ